MNRAVRVVFIKEMSKFLTLCRYYHLFMLFLDSTECYEGLKTFVLAWARCYRQILEATSVFNTFFKAYLNAKYLHLGRSLCAFSLFAS